MCLFIGPLAAQNTPTKMDSTFYALGILMHGNLSEQFGELNIDDLAKGLKDAQAGNATLSPEEANAKIQAYMQKKQESAGAEARKAGEEFLAENAKRPEVKVTDSGLQYEVLKEGTGASPTATETVEVHYHGTLIDGTVWPPWFRSENPALRGTGLRRGTVQGQVTALRAQRRRSQAQTVLPQREGPFAVFGAGTLLFCLIHPCTCGPARLPTDNYRDFTSRW